MELWLVRTTENQIAGPFSKDRLMSLLQEGQLNFRDELCKANDEWFSLSETEEVRRRLGPSVPELLRAALRRNSKLGTSPHDSDLTEEVQAWRDDITEPGLGLDPSDIISSGAPQSGQVNPWFQEGAAPSNGLEATRVLRGQWQESSGSSPEKGPEVTPQAVFERPSRPAGLPPKIQVATSSVPESSLFRAMGLTLALLALVAVYWVFRILRSE
jgi:hypothetical protein